MKKNLTIIIPSYNSKDVIEIALSSLQKYKCDHFAEIIIVDDGSTSKPDYENLKKYCNFLLIENINNQGAGVARNTGIEHCATPWFTFLDTDDEITDKVEYVSTILEHLDAAAFYCGIQLEGSSCIGSSTDQVLHGKFFNTKKILEADIYFPYGLCYAEDTYFVKMVNNHYKSQIEYSDVVTYLWKIRKNSLATTNDTFFFDDHLDDIAVAFLLPLKNGEINQYISSFINTFFVCYRICEFDMLYNYEKASYNLRVAAGVRDYIMWKLDMTESDFIQALIDNSEQLDLTNWIFSNSGAGVRFLEKTTPLQFIDSLKYVKSLPVGFKLN